jgi:hypothetical protein
MGEGNEGKVINEKLNQGVRERKKVGNRWSTTISLVCIIYLAAG